MDLARFDQLRATLTADGPEAAMDRLCVTLDEQKDYANLFYALLMKERYALGLSPVPTEPAAALPADKHAAYEEAIRVAGRHVGKRYLEAGDIPRAWPYYRMLGEPGPVAEALEAYTPGDSEESQQVIEIAFHHGVHPKKGFEWILARYGLCSAITTLGGQDLSSAPDVRAHCVGRLVRALHAELVERLRADIARQEGTPPEATTVRELLTGRDWLFADEFSHVDVSHLNSVVQMSTQLPVGAELSLARELCAYGEKLPGRLQYSCDPPFEQQYRDYGVYLSLLAGDDVERGLAHFRAKVENADPETDGTLPAEVFINLLLHLGRVDEALAVARKHLARAQHPVSCPSIVELCQRTNDYRTLAEVAREQGDPVHYLAALIAARPR